MLAPLLADDFVLVGPLGFVLDKQQCLGSRCGKAAAECSSASTSQSRHRIARAVKWATEGSRYVLRRQARSVDGCGCGAHASGSS